MKNSVAMLLVFILSACNNLPVSSSSQSPIATTNPNTSVPTTQVSLQNVYNNSKYGYSLNYSNISNITVVRDEYVEIGDKITVEVMNLDPTAPRGDGAVIENTSSVQFSGYPAKLLTGYIGSVGGYMPQQFKKIVVERNGNYFVFTLYALGLHVTDGDISQIAQLTPDDVSLFDSIAASIQIP
ncbi:MAG: hypothetical protein U0V02_11035 [Anaerolineales bacterium]